MGLIQCHCGPRREGGKRRWRRKNRGSIEGKGREKERLLIKHIFYKDVGIIRIDASKPRSSPKHEMVLVYHFGETVSLFLRAKPFTKSQGTCHIKLSSLSEPGPLPQSQFLPDGPRMTCPD